MRSLRRLLGYRLAIAPHRFVSSHAASSLITTNIEMRLQEIRQQHQVIGSRLASPDLSVEELTSASRTYANLEKTVTVLLEREQTQQAISELETMIRQENQK